MSNYSSPSATARPAAVPFGRRQGRAHIIVVVLLLAASLVAVLYAVKLRKRKRRELASLAIGSQPAPAEVRLDGRFVGLTPMEIPGVARGEHLVTISLDGYEIHKEKRVLRGGRQEIEIDLERKKAGALTVHTSPEGAEVILDGQSRGNTPLSIDSLAPGHYRLVVRKAGHEMVSRELTIRGGTRERVDAKLENSVLKFLRGAVANNPKSLHYWTELGHYLGCHGQDKESAVAFKKGMVLCMSSGAKADEVRRHFQMLGRQMNWPGKDRSAFRKEVGEAFSQLVKQNSGDAAAMVRLAGVLERARRVKEALELYLRASRKTGGKDPNVLARGVSLATRYKRMDVARELVALMRKGRPTDYATRLKIAAAMMQSYGRLKGAARKELLGIAEKLYTEAAGLTKDKNQQAKAYYGAARAQGFGDKKLEAARSYGKAAEAALAGGKRGRRQWADWEFERANLLEKLGRKTDARGILTRIVSEGGKVPAVARAKKELDRLNAEIKKKPQK